MESGGVLWRRGPGELSEGLVLVSDTEAFISGLVETTTLPVRCAFDVAQCQFGIFACDWSSPGLKPSHGVGLPLAIPRF